MFCLCCIAFTYCSFQSKWVRKLDDSHSLRAIPSERITDYELIIYKLCRVSAWEGYKFCNKCKIINHPGHMGRYLLCHLNLTEMAYISTKLFLVQYNRMNNVRWDYTFKQVVLTQTLAWPYICNVILRRLLYISLDFIYIIYVK